jgi:transposase
MESTGVYWFALYELIEQRGMEVKLVNARYVKGLPGRKKYEERFRAQRIKWLQKQAAELHMQLSEIQVAA